MQGRTWTFLIFACAALSGCPYEPVCSSGFIGDRDQPMELQMIATDGRSGMLLDIGEGDRLAVEPPPQGGYVMYVAARARNLNGCSVAIAGRLVDTQTGTQLGQDARSSDLFLGADGWGRPDASSNANLSNVNTCPHYTAKDLSGQPFTLEVTLIDHDGRTGKTAHTVLPTCQLSDPRAQQDCICTCAANYTLGKCDFKDGGI